MSFEVIARVQALIERHWAQSNAWQDYTAVMRRIILPESPSESGSRHRGPSKWVLLPGLCCQAAGGHLLWADELTAAWLLLYIAAHVMDSVEDQDEPDAWWAENGSGMAINASTGLFFTAALILDGLHQRPETRPEASEVIADFYHGFLMMGSGQHRDLITPHPNLEQYFEHATAKSGAFFALACRSGARLVCDDPQRLEGFSQFGKHLGILIQILDDLEELQPQNSNGASPSFNVSPRSLAVTYALSVVPPAIGKSMKEMLAAAEQDDKAAHTLWRLLDNSGAGLYIVTELERHRTKALSALDIAVLNPGHRERLASLLPSFDLD